ncbi:hypothetical protein ACLOJK_002688 [Asimina triloba]
MASCLTPVMMLIVLTAQNAVSLSHASRLFHQEQEGLFEEQKRHQAAGEAYGDSKIVSLDYYFDPPPMDYAGRPGPIPHTSQSAPASSENSFISNTKGA